MKHLITYKIFETAYQYDDSGKLIKIPDERFNAMLNSGAAKKISLKDFFKGPIKSPYIGLVLKTNEGKFGVVVDVFERNGDWLFDLFLPSGEVEKNLTWSRDYKTAFGDRIHGWSAFGEDGVPNARHVEIVSLLDKCEDALGIDLGVAKPDNLN